jgi:hypothetical protein
MKTAPRRAYAMILVVLFLVLFSAVLGVACCELAAVIRTVSLQAVQSDRDEGSLQAAALAVALLETGVPPTSPYVCVATIDTPTGPRPVRVTWTIGTGTTWSVCAAPAAPDEVLTPMPSTLATPLTQPP